MSFPDKDGAVDREYAVSLIHAAIDGGVNYVDTAYAYHGGESENIVGQALQDGYRERNPLHKPYIQICKCLTGYRPPDTDRLRVLWGGLTPLASPLEPIGRFAFGELDFEVLEGAGGHLPGEIVLLDAAHRIALTGDIYVNIHGMTAAQSAYNQYAPILMTSVDTDPALCAAERKAVFARLTPGDWQIFGAHGAKKDVSVPDPA